MTFSLQLYTPVIQGAPQAVLPLDDIAFNWERSVRLNGGCWQGSFDVFGTPDQLRGMFDNMLGYHLEETSGGSKTWEGMIWELMFYSGNVTKVRSLDAMFNHVTATYLDDGEKTYTSAATNASSIARYGQREEILSLEEFPQASAEARRSAFLNRYSWPRRVPEAAGVIDKPHLKVIVRGYIFTLNWRFVTTGSGLANASTWIDTLIDTDSEFLTVGRIDTNALQVSQEIDTDTRVWDLISEYIQLGDNSYNPWRAYVDLERKFHYHQVDMNPTYIMTGGNVYSSAGSEIALHPWWVQPGVFRDVDEFLTGQETGSVFQDVRDFLVDEITVNSLGGYAFSTGGQSDSDYLAALRHYAQLQETGGTTSTDYNKWYWPDMTDEEREWWTETYG